MTPPGDVRDRMRVEWDRRADENARFFIASGSAESDEEFRASGERELLDIVLDGVVLDRSAEALEIGCGIGRLLAPLARRVAVAHGVDISPSMVARSKEFCRDLPNVRTEVTDGALAHLADTSLDMVFSFIVFQHIPEREPIRRYVEEAARVLRPGGLFRFQVDGRWRGRDKRTATTYDGVKLSPADVRELFAGTFLEIADEWGAETHYHWITARKVGEPNPRVRFTPRGWDEKAVAAMLGRCGVFREASKAGRVVAGSLSLRRALDGAAKGLDGLSDREFVAALHRRVFGYEAAGPFVERQAGLLASRVEFREDLLDILLLSAELRELVRPAPLGALPWYRVEGLRLTGAAFPPGESRPEAVVAGAAELLKKVPPKEAVASAFRWILGHPPGGEDSRSHPATPEALRARLRRLLAVPPPRPVPPPPPPGKLAALLDCAGVGRPAVLGPGESFAGEGDVARRLLESASDDDGAFVEAVYRTVLGREPDEGGAAWYRGRLAAGELGRPGLLLELLWSEELRSG